jgi:hypothetical protein
MGDERSTVLAIVAVATMRFPASGIEWTGTARFSATTLLVQLYRMRSGMLNLVSVGGRVWWGKTPDRHPTGRSAGRAEFRNAPW